MNIALIYQTPLLCRVNEFRALKDQEETPVNTADRFDIERRARAARLEADKDQD